MSLSDRQRFAAPGRDIVVVHSSDIHVDDSNIEDVYGGDGTAGLSSVLAAARAAHADVALLVGDTFEHQRLPRDIVDRAAHLLAAAGMPVVILPGNHDPLIPDSVYRRGVADPANVHVLGIADDPSVLFPDWGLEIWGRAHRDYGDMDPLSMTLPRRTFWQIAAAHGHYEPMPNRATSLRPSWLFGDAEIAATGADYVALGHWNRAIQVGDGKVPAYYSGSPDLARTVNLIRLTVTGQVTVTREPLVFGDPSPDR